MKRFTAFSFISGILLSCLHTARSSISLRSSDIESGSVLDGIAYCASNWLEHVPAAIREQNEKVLTQLGNSLPRNLKFLPLLEPYLTYMAGIPDPSDDSYIDTFVSYCNYRHGVTAFMVCAQSMPWMTSIQTSSAEIGNLGMQLYSRYCDTGTVKKSVMISLMRGKESKAIGQLADNILSSATSGTKMVCSDMIDGFFQTMVKFIGNNESAQRVLEAVRSGMEDFAKCLVASFSEGNSLKILVEHTDFVLLHMVGSNMAAISKKEVKSGRTAVAMVGYTNIITEDNTVETCATTGTHVLLENDRIAITGTMLYDRSEGSLLPYLAAVHVKVSLYKEDDWRPAGQVTYSTSLGASKLHDLLTSFWWGQEEMEGQTSKLAHGVSINSVGEMIDILDSNSQINIVLSKHNDKLNIVIRIDKAALFQSRGLLVDDCPETKHTAHFGVVDVSPECQVGCSRVTQQVANTMCKKDCDMKKSKQLQVYHMYMKYEEMLVIAATKDDLFEPMMTISTTDLPELPDHFFHQFTIRTTGRKPTYTNVGFHPQTTDSTENDKNNPVKDTYYFSTSSAYSIGLEPTAAIEKPESTKTKVKVIKVQDSKQGALFVPKPPGNKGSSFMEFNRGKTYVGLLSIWTVKYLYRML